MRVRVRSAWVAALVVWAIFPGTGELLENAAHFAIEGHLAHAAPAGDTHGPTPQEHGCSSTLHLCSCCHSIASTLNATLAVCKPPQPGRQLDGRGSPMHAELLARRLDRPPRA